MGLKWDRDGNDLLGITVENRWEEKIRLKLIGLEEHG